MPALRTCPFHLFGEDLKSEFSPTGTKPFIKREQLDLRNQRSSDECSSEVNGIQCSNRFTREWPPESFSRRSGVVRTPSAVSISIPSADVLGPG